MIYKIIPGVLIVLLFVANGCRPQLTCQQKINEMYNHLSIGVINDLIEIYREDYGSYPQNLRDIVKIYENGADYFGLRSELIPDFVRDPFNIREELRYYVIKRGSKPFYVLYSVGPDKIDNHKSEIEDYIMGDSDEIVFNSIYFDPYNLAENACEEKGDILINNTLQLPEIVRVEKRSISTARN